MPNCTCWNSSGCSTRSLIQPEKLGTGDRQVSTFVILSALTPVPNGAEKKRSPHHRQSLGKPQNQTRNTQGASKRGGRCTTACCHTACTLPPFQGEKDKNKGSKFKKEKNIHTISHCHRVWRGLSISQMIHKQRHLTEEFLPISPQQTATQEQMQTATQENQRYNKDGNMNRLAQHPGLTFESNQCSDYGLQLGDPRRCWDCNPPSGQRVLESNRPRRGKTRMKKGKYSREKGPVR